MLTLDRLPVSKDGSILIKNKFSTMKPSCAAEHKPKE